MEVLKRWWRNKYKLPSNHELFLESTEMDLLIEYYQDIFEANPLEAHRNEDGNIQFKDTGDELIDRWEEEIAAGKMPDLTEALGEGGLAALQRLREKNRSRGDRAIAGEQLLPIMEGTGPIEGFSPETDTSSGIDLGDLFS